VDNARLSIDGNVLGAGNLTYRKIKPGRHSYVVSSDGYQSATGTINLTAGKTRTLTITLASTKPEPIAEVNPAADFYKSGSSKLVQGEYAAAISDLDQAISIRPNYADAIASRAEANRRGRNRSEAYNDYVRAGDLYRGNNDTQAALSNYGQAIKLDPKSVSGHLGRAQLYLARGEEIAAITDFDIVVKIEKRNLAGYLGLGQARYNQGYYRKAIKHFKDARSLDSKNPFVHRQLMLSYYKAGDNKQVKKSHDKFTKYASAAELKKMQADKRFVPILEMVQD
jgi:tetratricopeptide (TPR) repeat protein